MDRGRKKYPAAVVTLTAILILTACVISPVHMDQANARGKKNVYEITYEKEAKDAVTERMENAIRKGKKKVSLIYKGKILYFNFTEEAEMKIRKKIPRRELRYKYNFTDAHLAPGTETVYRREESTGREIRCLKATDPVAQLDYTCSKRNWEKAKRKAKRIAVRAGKKHGAAAKVRYIHDYLCRYLSYGGSSRTNDGADALANRKTKCAGYAESFDIICYYAGIKSQEVEGYIRCSGAYHAWNRVKIAGKWKHVDCCWDDAGSHAERTWFLKSRSYMERYRTIAGRIYD